LNRINEIINGGDFELGKVAPWLTNLFFTGENYLTPQNIEEAEKQRQSDTLKLNQEAYERGDEGIKNLAEAGSEEYNKAESARAHSLFDKQYPY
jgi:hypothetical protein